jgi:molybdate transport system regulatory protein
MAKKRPKVSSPLSIRIRLYDEHFLGPGKVRLLELIGELGSISAAGREMGMAYRQAWLLVDELNSLFTEPVVQKQAGGNRGGGAVLTKSGSEVVARYREIEKVTATVAAQIIKKLQEASKGALDS